MKSLKIKFPNLKHISFAERNKQIDVPNELIELICELIPPYMTILTSYKKNTIEGIESEQLINYNSELKKRILNFNIEVELVFIVNDIPMIVKIYEDKELERKTLEIYPTKITTLNYRWLD